MNEVLQTLRYEDENCNQNVKTKPTGKLLHRNTQNVNNLNVSKSQHHAETQGKGEKLDVETLKYNVPDTKNTEQPLYFFAAPCG